jgi:hypothetical protein
MKPPTFFLGAAALLIVTAATALLPCSLTASAQDRVDASKPILAQAGVGDMACGPCALYNCMTWGDAKLQQIAERLPGDDAAAKVRGLIKEYGTRTSEAYGEPEARYTDKRGITWVDMQHFADDLLREQRVTGVAGGYLDREKDETPAAQARRVHRLLRNSLQAGFPPLIAFRSFVARQGAKDKEFLWNGLLGHWVTLVELPDRLAENEKGFRFGYVDPGSGKLEYGYVFAEEARNFTAAKGDMKKSAWIPDRPFLLVTAPSLRLKTQEAPWYARTTIILNYAVVREQ